VAPKTRQVVAVDWLDAAGASEWHDEKEAAAQEPPLCTTVGVIISRTKRRIIIAGTVGHGDDQHVGDVNIIPAGMVRAVEPLGEILIEEVKDSNKKARTRSTH